MNKTLDVGTLARICVENLLNHIKDSLSIEEIQERLKEVCHPMEVEKAIKSLEGNNKIAKTIGCKYRGNNSIYSKVKSLEEVKNDYVLNKVKEDLRKSLKDNTEPNYDLSVIENIINKIYQ